MDEQLRRTLNEKFEDLRASELLPDFNRDDSWAAIESQLDVQTPVRRPLPRWIYAAAAGIAGIIIGGLAMRYLGTDQQPPVVAAAQRIPATVPQQPVQVAVKVRNAPKAVQALPAAPRYAARLPHSVDTRSKQVHIDTAHAADAVAQLTAIPAATSPVPPPAKARARHLLDLDAQSRTAILNEQAPMRSESPVGQYIMVRAMPESLREEAPSAIIPIFR